MKLDEKPIHDRAFDAVSFGVVSPIRFFCGDPDSTARTLGFIKLRHPGSIRFLPCRQ